MGQNPAKQFAPPMAMTPEGMVNDVVQGVKPAAFLPPNPLAPLIADAVPFTASPNSNPTQNTMQRRAQNPYMNHVAENGPGRFRAFM
jgi:hypothetical protein